MTTFEEAVLEYGRIPICPKCGSDNYCLDGKTNANHNRYLCLDCNSAYTLLSNSIFNSSKISFHKLMNYINLISFNVPYELIAEILDIGLNSTIAHDGDHSHYELIKKLNLKEEVYKANSKDEYYLKNMALINNMCA